MSIAYLLIGGNQGNRVEKLLQASALINEQCGSVLKKSSIYETAAWGKTDQPDFLNQALEVETNLTAKQLMRKILYIEKKMGRERKEKMGPRSIDIDIIFFNNEIHNLRFLQIPHPQMQNRKFVLAPLHEINPDFVHPILKRSIAELLELCPDKLEVKKINE